MKGGLLLCRMVAILFSYKLILLICVLAKVTISVHPVHSANRSVFFSFLVSTWIKSSSNNTSVQVLDGVKAVGNSIVKELCHSLMCACEIG